MCKVEKCWISSTLLVVGKDQATIIMHALTNKAAQEFNLVHCFHQALKQNELEETRHSYHLKKIVVYGFTKRLRE
jgi:transposase-like protein